MTSNFYNFLFVDNHHVNLDGDNALAFLAIAMCLIMIFSLIITQWITTQKAKSKNRFWVGHKIPTSTNIKPNINKF